MGLDCIPLGIAKPGHEAEWQKVMEGVYTETPVPDAVRERLQEISVPAYEVLGAPVVGTDRQADAWVLERKPDDGDVTDEAFLQEMKGFFVLDLLPETCAGLPRYTNAGLYDEIDQTSFRGAFLQTCEDIIGTELLNRAWTDFMRPEEAVAYGTALLQAAERVRAADGKIEPPPEEQKGFLNRLLGGRKRRASEDDLPVEEKLDILDAAGTWYIFWGERGHPIWAYY